MRRFGISARVVVTAVVVAGAAVVVAQTRTPCETRHAQQARDAIADADPDEKIVSWSRGSPMGGRWSSLVVYGDLAAFTQDDDDFNTSTWRAMRLRPDDVVGFISCVIDDGMVHVPSSIPPRVQMSDLGGSVFAAKVGRGPARGSGLPDEGRTDKPDQYADARATARTLSERFEALRDSVAADGALGNPRVRVYITRVDPVGRNLTWTGPTWPTAITLPPRVVASSTGPLAPPEVFDLDENASAEFTDEGGRWPDVMQRAIDGGRLVSSGWRPIL